jgi:hypothetical protein
MHPHAPEGISSCSSEIRAIQFKWLCNPRAGKGKDYLDKGDLLCRGSKDNLCQR